MKKLTNILALALALVVCVGALTACSGGQEETTGSTSTTAPQATKPGTTAPQASEPAATTTPETSAPEQEETTTPSSSANAG